MASKKNLRFVGTSLMAVLFALPLSGCFSGRTKIVVSDGGVYDIYANDSYLCSTRTEDCSLTTRGGSGEVHLEAVKDGDVAGETYASRSITAASILWAPFTYYTSLFVYKAYPDEIYIYVGEKDYKQPTEIWTNDNQAPSEKKSGGSVWDKPLLQN